MDTSAAAATTAPTTSAEATTAPTAMDTSAATAPNAMDNSTEAAAATTAMETSAAAVAPTSVDTSAAEAAATSPTAIMDTSATEAAPNAIMDTSTEASAAPTAMETSAAAVAPTSMDTSAAEAAATAPTAMATSATAAAAPNAIMDISAASEAAKKKIEDDERAVEVETFLVDKLESDINRNVSPWSGEFKKCKKLLEEKLKKRESAPVGLPLDLKFRARFRRKVHLLTNLMADHRSFIDRANLCFGIRLLQIHKQIEADLSDPPTKPDNIQRIINHHTERVPSRPSLINTYGLNYNTQSINVNTKSINVDLMSAENLLLCRDYDSSSPEFNAVGICGAEGVGKTTLALELFHKKEVKSLFFPRIWICLTDRRKDEVDDSYEMFVAKRILMHLGFHGERIQAGGSFREEAIRAIRSELRRKRYLVVVDGVSEEMEDKEMMKVMKLLRAALPKGTEGALVVTGRAENVVKKMVGGGRNVVRRGVGGEEEKEKEKGKEMEEEENIHKQLPLVFPEKPEGWDWEIFGKAADEEGNKFTDKDEKLKVKNEVVKRSHGLPWGSTLLGIIRRELQIKNKSKTPAPTTTTTPPPPPPP